MGRAGRGIRAVWRADEVLCVVLVLGLAIMPLLQIGRQAFASLWLILLATLVLAALTGTRLGVADFVTGRARRARAGRLAVVSPSARGGEVRRLNAGGYGGAELDASAGYQNDFSGRVDARGDYYEGQPAPGGDVELTGDGGAQIRWEGAEDDSAAAGLYDLSQESVDAVEERLRATLRGQDAAIEVVIRALRRRAERTEIDPNQPLTCLLVGATGVGKTKLVRTLAAALGRLFLPYEMGKMKDKNNNSELWMFFGSPQGYNGGPGKLTSQVDSNPDAVVLLDEIEKADGDLLDAFYTMFDEGGSDDLRTGRRVDFSRTMIFMTSNLLKDLPEEVFDDPECARAMVQATNFFKEEALNRIQIILPFRRLTHAMLREIARLELEAYIKRLCAERQCAPTVVVDTEVLGAVVARVDLKYGARDIKRRLTTMVADLITDELVRLPRLCPLSRLEIRHHEGRILVRLQALEPQDESRLLEGGAFGGESLPAAEAARVAAAGDGDEGRAAVAPADRGT